MKLLKIIFIKIKNKHRYFGVKQIVKIELIISVKNKTIVGCKTKK